MPVARWRWRTGAEGTVRAKLRPHAGIRQAHDPTPDGEPDEFVNVLRRAAIAADGT